MENETIYIHYGASEFDPNIGFPIKNIPGGHVKPIGGFWACQVDSEDDWEDWCGRERFPFDDSKSIKFKLTPNANVVYLRTYKDLKQLPEVTPYYLPMSRCKIHYLIDFEKCVEQGIDAIELQYFGYDWVQTKEEEDDGEEYIWGNKQLGQILNGWDCDSIVILNPNIVEVIKED